MLVLFILFVLLLSIVWTTYKYGIGPTPTSLKVKSALLKNLPKIGSGSVYELGAGWGTLAFSLADKYFSNPVVAIEISPLPWCWMKLRQFFFPRKNLVIRYGDFFKINLLEAELLVCYLFPKGMQKLSVKLEQDNAHALVITHTFALPNYKPEHIVYVNDLYHTPIYFYTRRNRPFS